MCSGLLVKCDLSPLPLPLELRLCTTPRSGDAVLAGIWVVLLGESACGTGTEASVIGKNGSSGVWRVGLAVSKLGSKCGCWTGSCRWHCVNGEGWGMEMVPASSFVSKRVSP